jgi:hypothetical protein
MPKHRDPRSNWEQVENASYFCWRCGGRLAHTHVLENKVTHTHTAVTFNCIGEQHDGYCEVDYNYANYGGYN